MPRPELDLAIAPLDEVSTVTPEGERIDQRIEGVRVRPAVVQSDERGSPTEIYSESWDFSDDPLVYVYQVDPRRPDKGLGRALRAG